MTEYDKDTANKVISRLISDNHVDEQTLRSIMTDLIRAETRELTVLIHSLFCKDSHDTLEPNSCKFFSEEEHPECWEHPSHKLWSEKTLKIMHTLDIVNPAELTLVMGRVRYLVGVLEEAMVEDEKSAKLFLVYAATHYPIEIAK